MPDGHDHAAAGSPPTPEERAAKTAYEQFYILRHQPGFNWEAESQKNRNRWTALARAVVRAAVAAELEAVVAHFEECDRLDPSEWFPPASVAEYVRGRVAPE
jgi:hypothetical protein